MSNEALIRDLSADLTPVRRRSALWEIGLLSGLGAAELALFLSLGMMRPDMGEMITSPYMLWKLGSLAVLAGVASTVAIRSFSPTNRPRQGLLATLALALGAIVAGLFVVPGGGSHDLLDRLSPVHGLLCAASIIVLSIPMFAMLALLMRRGAPTHPTGSAVACGLAAGACGAFIFAFCCPMNDPLYIAIWYAAACAVVTATARWLLPRRFRL